MKIVRLAAAALMAAGLNGLAQETNQLKGGQATMDNKISLGAEIDLMTPVWVIGSYDKAGKANMMTAAWVGVCCSKPPCLAVSLRQATYTYHNILERKAFTG
jgi:flavin reductase (DIM6/NTAB) family NADH-FMN oxidoreductase RutF